MKNQILLAICVALILVGSVVQAGAGRPELRGLLASASSLSLLSSGDGKWQVAYDFRISHGINLGLDFSDGQLGFYPAFYFSGPFAFAFGPQGWEAGYVNEDVTGALELAGITLTPQPEIFGQLVSGDTHLYINYSQGRAWTDWELSVDLSPQCRVGVGEHREIPYLSWRGRSWSARLGFKWDNGGWELEAARHWNLYTPKPWVQENFREVSFYTRDRVKLYANWYRRGERRDTLVLVLNGFGATKDHPGKDQLASEIAKIYDVLVLDFRGHGQSAGSFTGTEAETMDVQAALKFAQKHGYEHVVLVGFSMGGSIALKSAALYPDQIDAVLTVSAPMYIDYENPGVFMQRLTGVAVESVPFTMRNISGLRTIPPEFAADLDLRPYLEGVVQPLLVIHGEKDWLIPASDAYAIYETVPAAPKKLVVLAESFHSEFAGSRVYQEIVGLITDWLEEIRDRL